MNNSWEKFYDILNPNYITVSKKGQQLHFYLKGNDNSKVLETAENLCDNLNFGKKTKNLKVKDVVGEMAFLENGVKIGCNGVPKKIAKKVGEEYDNSERREYLQSILKNF